jgi:phage baseplate assembly protein V
MNPRQISARLSTMISRGVITLVDDSGPTQLVQVETFDGQLADDVEIFQPWGVSFNPTVGSEVIVFALGGAQEHLIALCATDRDVRPTESEGGEGGLYTEQGWKVFVNEAGVTNMTKKSATQSFMRGEDVKAALESYASSVSKAVGQIKVVNHAIENASALATLEKANIKLSDDIESALSSDLKGE